MNSSDINIVQRTLFQGDRFLFGGTFSPLNGSTLTGVKVRAQVRPAATDKLIHDFGEITATESEESEGHFVFALDTTDTASWPIGVLYCDIEANVNNEGPLTVTRIAIDVKRSVTL